jgi:hypothetical protein
VSYVSGIVPSMSIPYRYLLGVSFKIPQVPSVRRSAELIHYPAGYSVVRFSGEREIVLLDVRESIKDLLKLVPVPRAMTDEEVDWFASIEDFPINSLPDEDDRRALKLSILDGELVKPDIDPEAIVRFINKWGLIGLLDPRRDQVVPIASNALSQLLNTPIPYRIDNSLMTYGDRKVIYAGDEIPIGWIEDVLHLLARMTRLTLLLCSEHAVKNSTVDLERKTMKRILSAWNELPFTFPDSEDPGDSKFPSKMWETTPKNRSILLDPDLCQKILSQFASKMNFYLQPISSQVLLTHSFKEMVLNSSSYEPAMASYLLSFWSDQSRTRFRCDECQNLYRPKRVKDDHRFCGTSCKESFHKRKYRQKKRTEKENEKKLKLDEEILKDQISKRNSKQKGKVNEKRNPKAR